MTAAGDRRIYRSLEMCLLLALTILPSIYSSMCYALTGSLPIDRSMINALIPYWSFMNLIFIGALAYVLSRTRRTFRDLGFSFQIVDLWDGALLFIVIGLSHGLLAFLQLDTYKLITGEWPPEQPGLPWLQAAAPIPWLLFFIPTHAVVEDLISRAYVITEVEALTRRRWLAVVASVFISVLTHLGQGIGITLSLGWDFLVFSAYYVNRKRILPIIVAHVALNAMRFFLT